MPTASLKKLLTLPATFEPNALYLVQYDSGKSSLYLANAAGSAVRELISPSQQTLINQLTQEVQRLSTGFQNRIINPSGLVDQWNLGSLVSDNAGSSPFACDRWRCITTTGATVTTGRVLATSASTMNYISVQITSAKATVAAADQFTLLQTIEGLNVQDLAMGSAAAKTMTLSFKCCHSIAGKYSVAFFNQAFNRSYIAEYTQNVAGVFENKTITIKLDTTGAWAVDTNAGIFVAFDYGSGSNLATATVGAWQTGSFLRSTTSTMLVRTASAYFRITDVQFALSALTPIFEHRSIGTELLLCQRYFERFTVGEIGGVNNALLGGTVSCSVSWKATKRAVPTLVLSSGTVTGAGINSALLSRTANTTPWRPTLTVNAEIL